MTYTVLEQFLSYVLQNNIHLTLTDKKFLLNTPNDITLNDLINWLDSDIRKIDKVQDIFSEVEIGKEQFRLLLSLKSSDMYDIINCINSSNKDDLAFSLIATALLKQTSKKDKTMLSKEKRKLNLQIVKDLVNSELRNERLEAITSLPVYSNSSLREKILKDNNISEMQFFSMNQMLRYYRGITSDIVGKYVYFILESDDLFLEEHSIGPAAQSESIERLETMTRAKDAILSQDSYEKANQVMHAALLRGIYRNKEIFRLIQELDSSKEMANVISLCKYNRFRKDINFIREFSSLYVEDQKKVLRDIKDQERKENEKRRKTIIAQKNKKFEGLNRALMKFFTEDGVLNDIRAFRALNDSDDKGNLCTRSLIKKKK